MQMGSSRVGSRWHVRAWLQDMRIAFGTLVGRTPADHALLSLLSDRPALVNRFAALQAEIPQAEIADDSVTRSEYAPWRDYFAAKLTGRGLEIGALHRPLPTHPGMTMTYLDRADVPALKRASPEIAEPFVPVHVIDDAETLATVGDGRYDFVVAAHVLEHMRNPIGALANWLRVLVPGGLLYLIVPDKRRTFDRPRVRTLLEHLVLDYESPSRERDFEHYLEYAVHVHRSSGRPAIAEAHRLAAEDYSIHFHTFLPKDVVALVRWIGAEIAPAVVAEGPAMSPNADEFHILIARPH